MPDSKFIHRKQDHLKISLLDDVQAVEARSFDRIHLIHDSLPEIDLADVSIETEFLGRPIATPFYVAGMTAGHEDAHEINTRLARAASERGWLFGIGSQRRELDDAYLDRSVEALVASYSDLKLISNLGISQLIELYLGRDNTSAKKIERITQRSRASLIAIHLNPLQEAIQPEGTPNFKYGVDALQWLTEHSPVPVVVKETGSGMSEPTLRKLRAIPKLFAVDVSGMGGTHWGRVEGLRSGEGSRSRRMGETFREWGVPTLESAMHATSVFRLSPTEVWASGGIRSGLDAAKLLALGCQRVGFAQPALKAALAGEHELHAWMATIEQELKISLFCTGSSTLSDLNEGKIK